jgi:hypothetical protein
MLSDAMHVWSVIFLFRNLNLTFYYTIESFRLRQATVRNSHQFDISQRHQTNVTFGECISDHRHSLHQLQKLFFYTCFICFIRRSLGKISVRWISCAVSGGESMKPVLTPSGATVAFVPEDAPPKTFVAHLSVTDPDSGANGRVNCSLLAGAGSTAPGSTSTAFTLVRKYANEYQVIRRTNAELDILETRSS